MNSCAAGPRTPALLRMVRVRSVYCRVARAYRCVLTCVLHLPPSAVSLVGDVRFRRSAQRLARLP
jgi:hypothetical protein